MLRVWQRSLKHCGRVCVHCNQVHSHLPPTPPARRKTTWSSKEVRKTFLDYFCEENGHTSVLSSSVIPQRGAGTYFTNAGMNQFKSIFLGETDAGSEMSNYRRVANSQRCIRVGGKHNDLKDVGKDLYHHTFFEMLGNWSFGDYFKREACKMALELLVDVYNIPLERLYFTYFAGDERLDVPPDLETKELWLELKIPANRILPFGVKDNFWDMGSTGPCGPCTEIHYDHLGHRDAAALVNAGFPDVVEIWNLVFIQYDRMVDQSLKRLPKHHVDTGMGLERLCAVLNKSQDNYSTDLFQGLFSTIHTITGSPVYQGHVGQADTGAKDKAYRIVADHARMCTVAIGDGLLPSGDGLGHKLRQVIHHALHHARTVLHAPNGTLGLLVNDVAESLGDAFPECFKDTNIVQDVLDQTEVRYLELLQDGYQYFDRLLAKLGPDKLLPEHLIQVAEGRFGRHVPLDVLCNIALEKGHYVDVEDVQKLFLKDQLQTSSEELVDTTYLLDRQLIPMLSDSDVPHTEDHFKYLYNKTNDSYDFTNVPESSIVGLVHNNSLSSHVSAGDECSLLLDKTCFYAEGGGQRSDQGTIVGQTGGKFRVINVRSFQDYVLHTGYVEEGSFTNHELVQLQLDEEVRKGCMRNHTATHLLNCALQEVLGTRVSQLGSSVLQDKFTFDFSCFEGMTMDQVSHVESLVRSSINQQIPVYRTMMYIQEAMKIKGLLIIPNEVYPEQVYLVSIGQSIEELTAHPDTEKYGFSLELCAGTHVHNTADIGQFVIVKLSGVAQSTKRVTCVTGHLAQSAVDNLSEIQDQLGLLKAAVDKQEKGPHLEQWTKTLYKMLSQQPLPKVGRDQMMINLTRLHEKIRRLKNVDISTIIAESIQQMLSDEESPRYLVTQVSFEGPRQVRKALRLLDLCCPIVAVSRNNRELHAAVVTPQGWNGPVTAADISAHLCQVCGGKVKESKALKSGDLPLYIVTLKNPANFDLLLTEATKYLHEVTRMKS